MTSQVERLAVPDGLPAGTIRLAALRWRQAEAAAQDAGLRCTALTDADLDQRLAEELTAPLRLEDWPDPTEPRAAGDGWVHDEVVDEDREGFEAFTAANPDAGPEQLASRCQELRWPVLPYRQLPNPLQNAGIWPEAVERPDTGAEEDVVDPPSPNRPPLVLDLTTHWAGPLATSLLADAGAEIIKVDPSSRPDGFRARPALFRHLNHAKQSIDLDLRSPEDRERFEQLARSADLVVESFSRRVLPNLGYDRHTLAALNPALAVLSIKAFPAGTPEADWLAYGPGVHAASGLGWPENDRSDQTPRPAPVAYPDLVAGVTAFAAAARLLAGRRPSGTDRPAGRPAVEVSLAGSIAPLVRHALGCRSVLSSEAPSPSAPLDSERSAVHPAERAHHG
ncbi:MAG: CoA transferase [Actinomycetota bacterium]